jgi:2-oxoisovalerate dehydrogenase E2 component (dihydrolipoyl transacylase)
MQGQGRSRINAEAGLAATVNDFIMKATVAALVEAPCMLSSIDGDEIVRLHAVNLSMAVALEIRLIVPVIRRADKLTLSVLAARFADIAKRAPVCCRDR